jgi:hypothetical protein
MRLYAADRLGPDASLPQRPIFGYSPLVMKRLRFPVMAESQQGTRTSPTTGSAKQQNHCAKRAIY